MLFNRICDTFGGQFNHEVIGLSKRCFRKLLLALVGVIALSYEFYTFVPDRIIYIGGAANSLPKYVSTVPGKEPNEAQELRLFGVLPYKSVTVNVIEDKKVILGGESIGVSVNVDGVMVLGFSDFYSQSGKKICPAKEAGIRTKDVIKEVNGEKVRSASQFSAIVDRCAKSELTLTIERDGKVLKTSLVPQKSAEDDAYHLGLWARDGTSGIGTLTFVTEDSLSFGALGHSINDAETGDIIKLGGGNIYYSSINDIRAATHGLAGELAGVFVSSEIGEIKKNSSNGIFGTFNGQINRQKSISIAPRNSIKEGEASIFCCIDGDKIERFSVNIEKIDKSSYDNKSMIIKVTDERLINRTGGIVQGMSGSPIVQDGKLVGAVTHVFVNDPTRGYAIFIENMLAEAE